tara:strand:- start:21068 stop:30205 length:9138 start_codon:yes stop_codon:yes gene_type:complete
MPVINLVDLDSATLHSLFEAQADRAPERTAIRAGADALAYRELGLRASRIARVLRSQGACRGQRVGICVTRGADMLAAILGILKTGAAYVPLDPAFPQERLRFMVEDAQLALLVSTSALASVFEFPRSRQLLLDEDAGMVAAEPATALPADERCARAVDPAYVTYTSGSTGQPKGVVVSHQAVVNLLASMASEPGLCPDDVLVAVTTLSFDIAVLELHLPLMVGATVVIASRNEAVDGRVLGALLERQGATVMQATPVTWRMLLKAGWRGRKGFKALVGGEGLPKDLADQLIACGVELWNMYGPTETTVWSTCTRVTDTSAGISIGRPINNTIVYIVDDELNLCLDGAAGELCIGGKGLAQGYWRRPELTADRFVADPFGAILGAKLYRTGDRARWRSDGTLEHLGRFDFQVKIRGYRIELGEIEASISGHPAVSEAVVIARNLAPGDDRLVAYVVPHDDEVDIADLRRRLSRRLPSYMVPSAFVVIESLPLTPNAKIDRNALPEPPRSGFVQHEYVAATTPVEKQLVKIWCESLGLERIGIRDNFFELGGHSLLAASVVEKMCQVGLGGDVSVLYLHPTVDELSRSIAGHCPAVQIPANGILAGSSVIAASMLSLVKFSPAEVGKVVAAVPGGPANIQDVYPLAPLQEGILFHHRSSSGGIAYLTKTLFRFDCKSRLERYLAAYQAVVDRNDILRTAIVWEGLPEPVQVVCRSAPLRVEEVQLDLSMGDAAQQLCARFAPGNYRFDVSQAPLFRLFIAHDASSDRWLMYQVVHHLIDDQVTNQLVREEIQACLDGREGELPAPIHFREFVAQSRLTVTPGEHEEFFVGLLGDVDEATAPFGLTDVQGDGSGIEEAVFWIDSVQGRRLREVGKVAGVSPASLFHLAWGLVLARLSGREDVVFGTVLLGRMHGGRGFERVLGTCINTLPVRIRVGDEDVQGGLQDTHAQLARLLKHEHAPLALAQRCSAVSGGAPLFSALLNYRYGRPEGASSLAIEGVEVLGFEERTSYPLTLSIDDLGGKFRLVAQVQHPIEASRICGYMDNALRQLADALESGQSESMRDCEVLGAVERRQILIEWNDTQRDYGPKSSLHRLIESQAARTSQAVAVEFEGRTLSYAELNRRSNQLARFMRLKGVRPGGLVGVFAERSFEMVVALVAVLKSGGAYVPLDPSYPPERLAHMLEDARACIVLAQPNLASQLPPSVKEVYLLEPSWEAYSDQSSDNLEEISGPHDLAYVIFTSGSTGRPKGAMIEHHSIVNRLQWCQEEYGLCADDRVLQKTQFSFDVSVWEFFWPLMTGARVVLARPDGQRDSAYLVNLIQEAGITIVHFVPSMLRVFLEAEGLEACSSLSRVLCSGEALSFELQERFFARLPEVELHNLYGPTEAAVDVTYWECRPGDGRRMVPIGRPVANTQVYVLDARMRPVPAGVAGELCIGGVQVGRGYVGRDDLTRERFVPDPYAGSPVARLYRTGDLVRHLPDGAVEFLGRLDHQVKIRGQRIELGEIEAVLGACPGVRQGLVMAREDTPGDQRLVAYVVAVQEAPSVSQLRERLARELPGYMVPSAFVFMSELPLTASGKVDRKALAKPEGAALGEAYAAPCTEAEEVVAKIWAEVLQLERVGRGDNFFELGGHSLLAVSVVERMRRAGLRADVQALFVRPTIEAMAAQAVSEDCAVEVPANLIPGNCHAITPEMLPLVSLSQEEIDRVVAAVPGGVSNTQDIYPLAPLQEGFLFHHRMDASGDTYVITYQFAFDDRERLDGYLQALQFVVDRNDIFRTAVIWEGLREPVQVVWRGAPLNVREVDLSPVDGDAAEQLSARFNLRNYQIDVRQAPLMHLFVARDPANGRWVMQQVVHHLIEDMETMRLQQEEVSHYLLGRMGELPPPQPFRKFVAQSRAGVSIQEHEAFFTKMLGHVKESTMAFGLDSVQVDASKIEETTILVDFDLASRLRKASRSVGVSAASVFHLAWALVLARVSGCSDVVFGSVLLGRMQLSQGAERVLGPCINTLPVCIEVGASGVRDSLRVVHDLLTQLMRHEHAPLAVAQRCSAVAASAPLFNAILNYRHSQDVSDSLRAIGSEGSGQDLSVWRFEVIAGREFVRFEERTSYPFELTVDDFGDEFGLNTQVLAPLDPERIASYVQRALEQIADALERAPASPVSSVDILPVAERCRTLEGWNGTVRDYGADACLHHLIERRVALAPHDVALEFAGQSLTYAELNRRANQLARFLRLKGVKADVLVGVFAERSLEMVVSLLAVLKSGGAYVPLDPSYPVKRLGQMLEDAQVPLVLCQQDLAGQLPSSVEGLHLLDASWGAYSDLSGEDLVGVGAPSSLAYVMFTSGSTGRPKGVMIEHRSIVNRLHWCQQEYGLGADDRVLQKTQFSFDVSTWEFFWPLLVGARLVVARPGGHSDSRYLSELIRDAGVTTLHFVPSMLRVFLDEGGLEACSSLRRVLCSGEALPYELQERFFARLPGVELHNLYGPTEAAVDVTSWKCIRRDGRHMVPIGRPVANTQIYVLDAQMRPVPLGVAGELFIGGVQVGRGYVGRDELTRERFVRDPYANSEGARLYKTGDLARYLPGGEIEFLGRMDFQVKIRGQRIELGEIEAALGAHAEVAQCVVLAREDRPGDQQLVAYVVALRATCHASDLKEHLLRALPAYMVPSAFVFMGELPFTGSGKLDRGALPKPDRVVSAAAGTARSRSDLEGVLIAAWEKTLGVRGVGVSDNFFELGGNSLTVMRLIYEVERSINVRMDLVEVFESPTIASMSASLVASKQPKLSAVIPLQPAGDGVPIFCLYGIEIYREFAVSMGGLQPVFGVYVAEEDVGVDQAHLSSLSVEQLAESYRKAILKVRPSGPYRLAGVSLGGVVAVELASQLRKSGAEVDLVFLLDAVLPRSIHKHWGRWFLAKCKAVGFRPFAGRTTTGLWSALVRASGRCFGLKRRGDEGAVHRVQMTREVARVNAMKKWRGKGLTADFDVVLFRAMDPGLWEAHVTIEDDYGWGKLLQGALHVELVEGDHVSLLKSPYVQDLGVKAMQYLSIAGGSKPSPDGI